MSLKNYKNKSNSEILEETYYEYHGKEDDGNHIADTIDEYIIAVSIEGGRL